MVVHRFSFSFPDLVVLVVVLVLVPVVVLVLVLVPVLVLVLIYRASCSYSLVPVVPIALFVVLLLLLLLVQLPNSSPLNQKIFPKRIYTLYTFSIYDHLNAHPYTLFSPTYQPITCQRSSFQFKSLPR